MAAGSQVPTLAGSPPGGSTLTSIQPPALHGGEGEGPREPHPHPLGTQVRPTSLCPQGSRGPQTMPAAHQGIWWRRCPQTGERAPTFLINYIF